MGVLEELGLGKGLLSARRLAGIALAFRQLAKLPPIAAPTICRGFFFGGVGGVT